MDPREGRLDELDAQVAALKQELARIRGQAAPPETEAGPLVPGTLEDRPAQREAPGGKGDAALEIQARLSLLEESIEQNDAEIDVLQSKQAEGKRPWYREIGTVVGVLAFVFSFATTMVSYSISAQQRIANDRAELRGFLQRLLELSKENTMLQTDASTQGVAGYVSSFITYETGLLVYQAVEVMDRLPGRVTANEYNLVAEMSNSIGDYDQSYRLLQQAVKVSKNANEEVATLRGLAQLYYATGHRDEGIATYEQALTVTDRYPSLVPMYEDWTNAQTEIAWAGAELGRGDCTAAQRHMEIAHELARNVGIGATEVFLWQLERAQEHVDACVAPQ